MITPNIIWIFSLSAFVVVAIICFALLFANSTVFKKEFSFLRSFPFETNRLMPSTTFSLFKPLMFVLTGLAFSPLFVVTPLINEFGSLGFLVVFITCIFGLSAISNCLLFFFDARYTKVHLALVTVSMCLALLANVLATILSVIVFKNYIDMSSNHVSSLILIFLNGLLAIVMLLIIINPRLTEWAKLESQDNLNGEKTYKRGKVFILALSEWITILASIIGEILFFLSLI